ncbi:MAG TPA: hypothetical protein VK208_18765 [Pyrinomonadaceae bacterium]|nr:hypothetical protein [Pyrinomonadaceae bacterium]
MKKTKTRVRATIKQLRAPFNLAAEQERMRRRHGETIAKADVTVTTNSTERFYTVAEIAELWGLSKDTVRKAFCKTPGVLKIGSKKYQTLRIPEKVLRETTAKLSACRKQVE